MAPRDAAPRISGDPAAASAGSGSRVSAAPASAAAPASSPVPAATIAAAPASSPVPAATIAAPPASSPVPVAPAPAPRAAPAPPLTVTDPEELNRVWLRLLQPLPDAIRVQVHEVATPLAVEAGRLRVGVRNEVWRNRVRDHLGSLDLAGLVGGLSRVEVIFEAERGRTGREVIAEADVERRAAARDAAERSDAIKRLIQAFDGELEEVVPSVPVDALAVPVVADAAEDYAAGGGLDG